MSKFLISIISILITGVAFAAGENIPTSKSYVDATVAEKQDKISANDGVPQILTNTGTAGEYGTKNIYDTSGEYSTQTDALIDAVTMNTAVQNAIDSEFTCVEYDQNDSTNCLLFSLNGVTETQLPNGYNTLSYISTNNAYKDCGWNPTLQTYKIRAKFKFNSLSTTKYNAIFGADNGMYFGVSKNGLWSPHILNPAGDVSGNLSPFIPISTNVWYTIEDILDRSKTSNNLSGNINGTEYTGTRLVSSSGYSWYIGSFTSITNYEKFDGDIAYIQVYENDILIHDYVPARNGGQIGMYDTVSNQFITIGNEPVYIPNN